MNFFSFQGFYEELDINEERNILAMGTFRVWLSCYLYYIDF